MSDTSELALKSSGAGPREKLLRMLRSMLRRSPRARLIRTPDGFGAWLEEGVSIKVSLRGHWTDSDIRDYCALFATWVVVDGPYLRSGGTPLHGYSPSETAQSS